MKITSGCLSDYEIRAMAANHDSAQSEGIDGKQTIEINDVLNERNLWRHEYAAIGEGSEVHEEAIADAGEKIRMEGWGEN